MLHRLRQRLSNEEGFTLIELLVVILIIGILAAIAIPAFLSQTGKAGDAAAKTQVGTLQTTMETCSTENNGSFTACTQAELEKIEPTLKDKSTAKVIWASVKGTATGYEVESEAVGTTDKYKLVNAGGEITRSCTTTGTGNNAGGCKAGSW